MRTEKNRVEFFLAMKRKPAQQKLLDNVKNLSDEDIEKCGQAWWIRDVLRRLRDGYMSPDQIVNAMYVTPEAERKFDVFRFKQRTTEIELKNGTVEVNYDDLILILDDRVIISNFAHIVYDLKSLLEKSIYVDKMYKTDFFALYNAEIEKKRV